MPIPSTTSAVAALGVSVTGLIGRMGDDLQEWWATVSTSALPGLRGLWFGLVELENVGWCMYIAGTEHSMPEARPLNGRSAPTPGSPQMPTSPFHELATSVSPTPLPQQPTGFVISHRGTTFESKVPLWASMTATSRWSTSKELTDSCRC